MNRPSDTCPQSLRWIATLVTAVGFLIAAEALAQEPPRKPDAAPARLPAAEEHWYVVKLQDQKCGYMHVEIKPVGEEVHTRSTMSIQISRGPTKLKITVDQQFMETRDGRPLGFRQVMQLGEQPMTIEGTIRKGRLHLVRDQFNGRQEDTYDFDPEIKFAWGLNLEQLKHGLEPGTTFRVKSYDPTLKVDAPFEVELKVDGKESQTLPDGAKRKLTKVTSTILMQTPISTVSWLDDNANPVVMDFNVGGFMIHVLAATKEQALAGDGAPELFLNTFVEVNKRIPAEAKSVQLHLRLPKPKQGEVGANLRMPDLPNTSAQSVRRVNDHEAIITIRRLDWEALRKIEDAPVTDKTLKEHLRASPIVDIDDKRIKRHARKAVKGADTPAEKADALRRYVTDFVETKNMDVGFASASEVIRNRKGDCSEHAVLLAALARAAGLPARGVSGIVQIPAGAMGTGKGAAFGYHMWTQVNIGGQWVDIDAALRQTDCDVTHVALAIMPLNDEGLGESMISILPMLGRLQIEIKNLEE
jgi:transglutaminase-like putative cysteine protease